MPRTPPTCGLLAGLLTVAAVLFGPAPSAVAGCGEYVHVRSATQTQNSAPAKKPCDGPHCQAAPAAPAAPAPAVPPAGAVHPPVPDVALSDGWAADRLPGRSTASDVPPLCPAQISSPLDRPPRV